MTICCKGALVDLSHPKVMGVLNSTPDSFYDGGKYWDPYLGLKQVEVMLQRGSRFHRCRGSQFPTRSPGSAGNGGAQAGNPNG